MKWIYSAATHVTIWTGELNPNVPDACTTEVRQILDRMPDSTAPSGLSSSEVLACQGIFEMEWFTRIWVLQEVFLAKEAFVLYGDIMTSWSTLLRLHDELYQRHPGGRGIRKSKPAILYRLFTLQSGSSAPGYTPRMPEVDILDVLVAALDLDATDPRDKIFALLNIFPHSTDTILQPDYTKHVADVFRDFTRGWISSRNSLRILSSIHCSPGRTRTDLAAECAGG